MIADVAQVLRNTLRESDIVARMGGDEFCVLAVEPAVDGAALRERLLGGLQHANTVGRKRRYPLAASIGYTQFTADAGTDLDQQIMRADAQMYEDKRARRAARG